jgi:hypothetical protein
VFLPKGGEDVTHVDHLNEVLHLLIAVNYYDPAILALLVSLQVLLQFLLALLVAGEQGGDHGRFFCLPVHLGRGGVEFVLGEFGVAARVCLPGQVLLILAIREGLLGLRAMRVSIQLQLEVLEIPGGGVVLSFLFDGACPSAPLEGQLMEVDLAGGVCGKFGAGVVGEEGLVGRLGLGATAWDHVRHFENQKYYRK